MTKRKKKKKNINKEDNNKKESSKNIIRCPNCKSEKIKNNQPRSIRFKINAISVVAVFVVLAIWIQLSESMKATPITYAVILTVMIGIAAARISKNQYQCKNCKIGWDKKLSKS